MQLVSSKILGDCLVRGVRIIFLGAVISLNGNLLLAVNESLKNVTHKVAYGPFYVSRTTQDIPGIKLVGPQGLEP